MYRLLRLLPILLLMILLQPARAQDNSRWEGYFGPAGVANSQAGYYYNRYWMVYATASIGNDLYIGGSFTSASGVPTVGVARWDGARWSPIPGMLNGSVSALAAGPNGDLYVAGSFTLPIGNDTLRSLARWDGSQWHRVGPELQYNQTPAQIVALAVDGNNVYVAGSMLTHAGAVQVSGLARWDGSQWSGLGNSSGGAIYTMAAKGGRLYVGGYNVFIGDKAVSAVAMWDGAAWSSPATTITNATSPGVVKSLLLVGDRLIIGGQFTAVNTMRANSIAEFSGGVWRTLGNGVYDAQFNHVYSTSTVHALAAIGDDIYVGGGFQMAGSGVEANNLARWTGSYWTGVGRGVSGFVSGSNSSPVLALLPFNGSLAVGGTFLTVGNGLRVNGATIWNPASGWSALRGGNSGSLYAAASDGRQAFIGGDTTTAGGTRLTHVGALSDTTLFVLPEMNGAVNALTWKNGVLYAGGRFTTAGTASTRAIAKWNGTFWSILEDESSNGVEGEIHAIAVDGENVYAGGEFTSAGDGRAARNIARWDGTRWHALGDGIDGRVNAIAIHGGKIYAGGDFSTAGGKASRGLAVWDGSEWSNVLNGDITGIVYALAVQGENLLVGGEFQSIGGISQPGIAAFDGEVWSALGSGVNGVVRAIAADGSNVYIGGEFSKAGGVDARNVAVWSGASWSPLGSGIDGRVNDIDVTASGVYFVGSFSESGGKSAYNVARWLRGTVGVPPSPSLPRLASTARPNPFSTTTTIEFSLPSLAETTLEVLDLHGRVVATLVDANLSAGAHRYTWTPDDGTPTGLYLYRLRSGAGIANGKVVLGE
jgi:trimeric autotransporter adhesin